MIGFFRKIRKQLADDNKPLKYARYAIGEVILIVIGILIALQLNNLNEDKIDRVRERIYLTEYLNDLKICKNDLQRTINRSNDFYTHSDSLFKVIHSRKFDLHTNEVIRLIMGSYGWSTFEGSDGTVSEILNGGNLHLIRNPEIRSSIASWNANLKDVQSWEVVLREFVEDYYSFLMDYMDFEITENPRFRVVDLVRDTLFVHYAETITRPNLVQLFDQPRFKVIVQNMRFRQKLQNTKYLEKEKEIDSLIEIVKSELQELN